jgi:hypothetical protein
MTEAPTSNVFKTGASGMFGRCIETIILTTAAGVTDKVGGFPRSLSTEGLEFASRLPLSNSQSGPFPAPACGRPEKIAEVGDPPSGAVGLEYQVDTARGAPAMPPTPAAARPAP